MARPRLGNGKTERGSPRANQATCAIDVNRNAGLAPAFRFPGIAYPAYAGIYRFRIERMQPPPVHRPGSKPDATALQTAAGDAGLQLPEAAIQAFRDGRMIEAIKLIRIANPGLDLARAKAAVERLQGAQRHATNVDSRRRQDAPDRSMPARGRETRTQTVEMGDPPGQLRWVLVVIVLLGLAIWIGFGGVPG